MQTLCLCITYFFYVAGQNVVDYDGNLIVSTDGGRYDTDLTKRIRIPVYWEDNPNQVRRCSWFFKNDGDSRFIPYEEDFATELEVCHIVF